MAKTQAQNNTSLANWVTLFGATLTKLDNDAGVAGTNYAASCALMDPKEPNEGARKLNALCLKLDADLTVVSMTGRSPYIVDTRPLTRALSSSSEQPRSIADVFGALVAQQMRGIVPQGKIGWLIDAELFDGRPIKGR